jgi:uncharacterized membrane protein
MSDEALAGRDRQWVVPALLLTLFTLAALLRLSGLADDSIWWDEAATLQQVDGSLLDVFVRTARDTYPPAYNILAWFSVQALGETEIGLRFPAALIGALAVPVTYLLGRRVGGQSVGLFAAILIALSPFAIFYSQDARPYSLLCLAAALHLLVLLRVIAKPSLLSGVGLALSAALLLYSHPYGFLAWVSAGAGLLLAIALNAHARRAFWPVAAAELAGMLLFAPWAYILVQVSGRLAQDGFWLLRPGPWDALGSMKLVAGGLVMSVVLLALIIVAVLVLPRRPAPAGSDRQHAPAVSLPILLAAAFGPAILGYAISQVTTPIYLSRYLICALPAIVVVAAMGAGAIASTPRRSLSIVAALLLLGSLSLWTDGHRHEEDWRGVASALEVAMDKDDCILTNGGNGWRALRFYLNETPECRVRVTDEAALEEVVSRDRLFLVLSRYSGSRTRLIDSLPGEWTATSWNYLGVSVTVLDRRRG